MRLRPHLAIKASCSITWAIVRQHETLMNGTPSAVFRYVRYRVKTAGGYPFFAVEWA